MYTVSVSSMPLGGMAGRVRVFPDVLQAVDKALRPVKGDILHDFVVTHIGDRVVCLTVSDAGSAASADAAVKQAYAVGEKISDSRKLFKSPADVVSTSMTFDERDCESFILFMAGSDDSRVWDAVFSSEAGVASAASVLLCRTEGEFASTAEVLERFACTGYAGVALSPVSLCDSGVVRTSVIPVVALGFSLGNGKLTGPLDLFDTPLFASCRLRASE